MAWTILLSAAAAMFVSGCAFLWTETRRTPPWPVTPSLLAWWGMATVAAALAVMVAAVALSLPAGAHNAPSGWAYESQCCNTTDCMPVRDGVIEEVAGGYRVRIRPGQHMNIGAGNAIDEVVPHGDPRIRVSQDSERHACVGITSKRLLCVYIPPGGV